MRTQIQDGDGHYEKRITRDDGATLVIWFVGRCWRYVLCRPGQDASAGVDLPGREGDAARIVRRLRRAFAHDNLLGV